jgi:hypothetical protein
MAASKRSAAVAVEPDARNPPRCTLCLLDGKRMQRQTYSVGSQCVKHWGDIDRDSDIVIPRCHMHT